MQPRSHKFIKMTANEINHKVEKLTMRKTVIMMGTNLGRYMMCAAFSCLFSSEIMQILEL